MGVIQGSINGMLGTAAVAATASKHIMQQEQAATDKALETLGKEGEMTKALAKEQDEIMAKNAELDKKDAELDKKENQHKAALEKLEKDRKVDDVNRGQLRKFYKGYNEEFTPYGYLQRGNKLNAESMSLLEQRGAIRDEREMAEKAMQSLDMRAQAKQDLMLRARKQAMKAGIKVDGGNI